MNFLIHLSKVNFSTLISRASSFPILEVSDGIFYLNKNNRRDCIQTLKILLRHRIMGTYIQ